MKNVKALISTLLVLIMCLSVVAVDVPEVKAAGEMFILDAGHGGSDPGACAHGRAEAADVLWMTMRVGELMSSVTSVTYTRTGDYFISLSGRCDIANGNGNNYFCSIHRNSGGGTGVETYYMTGGSSESARMAGEVNDRLAAIGGWRNRGVKTAYFTVITNTWMPAILAEVGFIDSTFDNDIFVGHFEELCLAIANGLLAMIGASAGSGYSKELDGQQPVDIGGDFYAHIRHPASGNYLTDRDFNVSVQPGVFDPSQTWHFTRQGDGSYSIGIDHSGCYMDVAGANYNDGTNIQMYQGNGSPAQKFFIYFYDGTYHFKTLPGDKTFDVDAATGNLQLYGNSAGMHLSELEVNARSFEILKLQIDGSEWNAYLGSQFETYIRNWHTGHLLTAEGDNAIFRDPEFTENQKWIVTRNEYGGHEIKSVATGKVLDVAGSGMEHGLDINLYDPNGSKAQNFFFINTGEARFYIKPSYSHLVMDMDAGNMEIHTCYYGTGESQLRAQVFEFITVNQYSDDLTWRAPKYFGKTFTAKVFGNQDGKYLTENNGVSMENANNSNNQIWTFTYDEAWQAYKVIGSSGKALDVQAAGWTSGTPLQMYDSNDTAAQRFRIYEVEGGYYISPANTQKIFDIDLNTGSMIHLYGNTPEPHRMFGFTILTQNGKKPVDLGETFTTSIKHKESGLYLTGAAEGILSCTNKESDWTFKRQADGSYEIVNKSFNKVLDVQGGNVGDGTAVQLWDANGSAAQRFFVYAVGDAYIIRSAKGIGAVDMDANSKEVHIYSNGDLSAISAHTFELKTVTLSSISVSKNPNKTTYTVGDTLDTTGLTIKANYSDNTSKTLTTGFTVSPSGVLSTAGTKAITVTYQGKTATFNVTVNEKVNDEEMLVIKENSKFEKSESYVKNVSLGIQASEVISQFDNVNVAVFDRNGNKVANNALCGTGYIVKLIAGNETIDALEIVITGDVDGNSKVDTTDYLRIKAKFNGTYNLTGAEFAAGDVCEDGKIDTTDYLRIKGAFLGTYDLQ